MPRSVQIRRTTDIFFCDDDTGVARDYATNPALFFYHPASTAEGSYTVSSKIHLFPPGQRNEGYGLILGGQNLDNDSQSYIYISLSGVPGIS